MEKYFKLCKGKTTIFETVRSLEIKDCGIFANDHSIIRDDVDLLIWEFENFINNRVNSIFTLEIF